MTFIIIDFDEGKDKWSYGLHFKWQKSPDRLVVQYEDGCEYDFYSTNFQKAMKIRDTKRIVDY